MSIGFVCEHCGQKLTVGSSRAGQRGHCPKCHQTVTVPMPSGDPAKSSTPVARLAVPSAEPPPAAKPSPPKPASPVVESSVAKPSKPVESALESVNVAAPSVTKALPADAAQPPASAPASPVAAIAPEVSLNVVEPPLPPPQPMEATELRGGSDELPAWIAQSEREESPWIYVDTTATAVIEPTKVQGIDLTKISIPRYVVFAQGVALGVVALVAFALGLLAGGASRSANVGAAGESSPCVVIGKVEQVTSGGTKFPDEGAVVILFPQDQRPGTEERALAHGLRPDDPPPNAAVPGLQMLRLMGAVYTRTDVAGAFRVTLPRGGKYYLLVVSHHANRRKGRDIGRADLAAMGRYLTPAADLIGDRRYRWRAEEFERDTEVLVVLD